MCVRFLRPDQLAELEQIIDDLQVSLFRVQPQLLLTAGPSEIAPMCPAPVIGAGHILTQAQWGFAKWDGHGCIVNARCESLATSPFFAPHIPNGRCIIPAKAYFEWEHDNNGKSTGRKFCFQSPTHDMLYMAGLARRLPDKPLEFTVITREASSEVAAYHDRMPLIFNRQDSLAWLSQDVAFNHLLSLPSVPVCLQ